MNRHMGDEDLGRAKQQEFKSQPANVKAWKFREHSSQSKEDKAAEV